jgi:hypothetical protein
MKKEELELLLDELDEALIQAFPGPEPMSVLVVGGACLVFSEITTRSTQDIDVIITDLMGSGEASLVYNLTPTTAKIRKLIGEIGRRHGLRGDERMFLNDDCASFLLELGHGHLPQTRLLRAYRKLHLYVPDDFAYILACKLMAGRPDKDFDDITLLCQRLTISTRAQALALVNRFFRDPYLHYLYQLPATLQLLFPKG